MGNSAWKTLLSGYETHQRASAFSNGTIRGYRYKLLDLAHRFPTPADVTIDDLLAILATAGWAASYRKSVRTCYRSFFGWAYIAGRLMSNPAADLPPVHVPRRMPRPAPEHIVGGALRVARPREAFMLRLGAFAGLRCCEIARVHAKDWDGVWLTVCGKGGKVRRVPILEEGLRHDLDQLTGYAFPNRWTGLPLTPGHVTVLLSAALAQTYTGHTLRHRYGSEATNRTKDIQAVAETMGHGSLDTTRLYCAVAVDRLLAVAAAAATPPTGIAAA